MRKFTYFLVTGIFGFILLITFQSCKTSALVKDKTGEVLWAENCARCHYSPDPEDYNDAQWEVISMHMRVRTNLTEEESEKITKFLQSAN